MRVSTLFVPIHILLTRVHGILFLRINISIYHFILALSQHRLSFFWELYVIKGDAILGSAETLRDTVLSAVIVYVINLLTFFGKTISSDAENRNGLHLCFPSLVLQFRTECSLFDLILTLLEICLTFKN